MSAEGTRFYGDGCAHPYGRPDGELLVHLISDHGPEAAREATDRPGLLAQLHADLHAGTTRHGVPGHEHPGSP